MVKCGEKGQVKIKHQNNQISIHKKFNGNRIKRRTGCILPGLMIDVMSNPCNKLGYAQYHKEIKLSRYTPWRHMGGEEV
jgi:hypothetical protein